MNIVQKTKGLVKVCPKCGEALSLARTVAPFSQGYYWICDCGYMINYQSKEASNLKEIEVK